MLSNVNVFKTVLLSGGKLFFWMKWLQTFPSDSRSLVHPVHYVQVQINRVHLFTMVQVCCFVSLWLVKSFKQTSILFPVMVMSTQISKLHVLGYALNDDCKVCIFLVFTNYVHCNATFVDCIYRESQKTWELEDDLGTLTEILEIMKGHSIKPIMRKMCAMLL